MLTKLLRTTSRNLTIPPVVKVLSLDARDTLITLKENPSVVYSRFAKNAGLEIESESIFKNFLKNYKRMSVDSPCFGFKDTGARVWWENLVAATLQDCSPFSEKELRERISGDLYNHYSTPEPWKLVEDDVRSALQRLRLKGIILVVTSNFDSRLKTILSEFNLSDLFSMIILSENGFVSDEEPEENVKDLIAKRRRANPMIQSTKKKEMNNAQHSEDDSDDSDDANIAVATHSFAATGEAGPSGPLDQGATSTVEIDTDYSRDSQAQFERVQQQLKEGVEKDGKILYKGTAMYGAKEAKDTAKGNASSMYNRVGPIRASQFLRATVRWDFAPDICKDYKETGFCTFGDSCKFVHDRSDYKHGWEIDEEYEAGKYGVEDDEDYEIRDQDDAFPEDCFICGNPFVDPIVTKCKHYFCTMCALNAFKKSSKCPVCHQNTEKIMNAAKDLINFLKRKKKLEAEKEAKQEEEEQEEEASAHEGCSHKHGDDLEQQDEGPEVDGHDEADAPDGEGLDEEQEIQMEDVEGLEGGENDSESDGEETED
ncbi:hypothetical protein L5515_003783 [Caenorhabditis briggsae]|uniref:RING finger protein n=1 Tax=Caenorhabditis briggsae TaxID=6238 RepID=A0AAE9EIR7_CAEBR|nr:hypothetical protein L5515_003783 [Caenorhabditis briggsae]